MKKNKQKMKTEAEDAFKCSTLVSISAANVLQHWDFWTFIKEENKIKIKQ